MRHLNLAFTTELLRPFPEKIVSVRSNHFRFFEFSNASTLCNVTLLCRSCVWGPCRARAHYRRVIMFPAPTFPGSDTVTPSRPVLLYHSLRPSPGLGSCSIHVPALLAPLKLGPAVSSNAKSNSCFSIPSQILSATILKQDWLCHVLKKTKITLRNLQRDALTIEILKDVFVV